MEKEKFDDSAKERFPRVSREGQKSNPNRKRERERERGNAELVSILTGFHHFNIYLSSHEWS